MQRPKFLFDVRVERAEVEEVVAAGGREDGLPVRHLRGPPPVVGQPLATNNNDELMNSPTKLVEVVRGRMGAGRAATPGYREVETIPIWQFCQVIFRKRYI